MDWIEIVANLVNGVLVIAAAQFLKQVGLGWLKVNAPWSLPILALFAAQLFGVLSSTLGKYFGFPIDFSPITALLTGSLAIAVYDTKHARTAQLSKRALG